MSIKDTWVNCHASICSISFLNVSGEKIASGTGFKVDKTLITNNHVYYAPTAHSVELKFVRQDGISINKNKVISYSEFKNRLLSGDNEQNWDYAILDLNDEEFDSIPSLELSKNNDFDIGDQIAILGFQFDQANLSIKQGIVSSRLNRNCVKYIQIDSSVNNGNSGGPLINISTNHVIGIVTRKHTGLTDAFEQLEKSLESNIAIFTQASSMGSVILTGIDPIMALKLNQEQFKIATKEIKRSANVGIGYAYELEKVLDYLLNK